MGGVSFGDCVPSARNVNGPEKEELVVEAFRQENDLKVQYTRPLPLSSRQRLLSTGG
jgi:hypothetical protein